MRLKPFVEESRPFDALLNDRALSDLDRSRITSYTGHEQYARAAYLHRRYLLNLSSDVLRGRLAYLIGNAVHVSSRGRYSINSPYLPFWRDRIAHTAEELATRGETEWIKAEALRHLPALGFGVPTAIALDSSQGPALFRYDKLQNLRRLQELGEVYLRCASTESPGSDAARADSNEVCVNLEILAADLDIGTDDALNSSLERSDFLSLRLLQPDFYMFCLSAVYDWRLFGDFGGNHRAGNRDEATACLVITDPKKFRSRFETALAKFREPRPLPSALGLRLLSGSALYYDPHDARWCASLFGDRDLQPFAKRLEYAYQREYRLVAQPVVPKGYVPENCQSMPELERALLYLGSLRDISYIVESEEPSALDRRHFLFSKDPVLLSSALGVTPCGAGETVRFIYSAEKKEIAQTDMANPVRPHRSFPGSIQVHFQEMDLPADRSEVRPLQALLEFHSAFDLREHGNHLISFGMNDAAFGEACDYRCYLSCPGPPDNALISQDVAFEFEWTCRDSSGAESKAVEVVEIRGETYLEKVNGVGEPKLQDTHRSVLAAEAEFVRSLIARRITGFAGYKTLSKQMGWHCSELKIEPLEVSTTVVGPAKGPERVEVVGMSYGGRNSPSVREVVTELLLQGDPRSLHLAPPGTSSAGRDRGSGA